MTHEELEAIEAREAAATPGPWVCWDEAIMSTAKPQCEAECVLWADANSGTDGGRIFYTRDEDAEFIAHARQDVPALLAEVKRLKAEAERLTRERDAAVGDLRASAPCKYCKHCDEKLRGFPCSKYSEKVGNQCSDFGWRGVRE